MTGLYFVIPGDIDSRTGGYLYDKRILDGLRQLGWPVGLISLTGNYPTPDQAAVQAAGEAFDRIPDNALVVVDGLALGALPDPAKVHRTRLRLVGLVHHPLAVETGLEENLRKELCRSERMALTAARHVIASSPSTARLLADFGVAADRVSVVEPGTDPAPVARGSGANQAALLCVGTLIPRKGHMVLVEALGGLTALPWHLTCAGSLDRDPACAAAVRRRAADAGLTDRITFLGEVASKRLDQAYASSDIFVLPSYFEGYGMAFTEAVARGLPIVGTTGGAIPETVPAGAAILVPPGDASALRRALDELIRQPSRRHALAEAACLARTSLPTWPDAIDKFAVVLRDLERA